MTTHAETAKAIKAELKEKFKGVRFSVRSESFAGGDAVTIYYPVDFDPKKVREVVDKYQEGHFDGMTDSYEYSNRRSDIPQVKYVRVQKQY